MGSMQKTLNFTNLFWNWRTFVTRTSNIAKDSNLARLIKENTELTTEHLTPELRLHLITPNCRLWSAPPSDAPFSDPYWAFYWPGGQAISRHILDQPETVRNRRVLDLGCGSGACGLAAAKAGATRVVLNDIDPVACVAAHLNLQENLAGMIPDKTATVEISSENWIDRGLPSEFDLILIGDMFYDEDFAGILYPWLKDASQHGCSVMIGDPGRHALSSYIKTKLTKLSEYSLPENCCLENRGFSSAVVWRLNL